MTTRRFAVRRLNPFGGVVQILDNHGGRATSLDGKYWEIQVLAEAPHDCWGSLNNDKQWMRFFRFGNWSRAGGLRRVPINPIMDVGAMLAEAEPVLDQLDGLGEQLPFPLVDNRELWLLDRFGDPLALLKTTMPEEDLDQQGERHWCAAPMSDRNLGEPLPVGKSPWADELEILIRRNASSGRAQWFEREQPGKGVGRNIETEDALTIPADDFPESIIPTHWEKPSEQALVDRWLAWRAPRLLCLPYLSLDLRSRLEGDAAKDAAEVATLWRLYPAQVDTDLIRKARVEARLRQAMVTESGVD